MDTQLIRNAYAERPVHDIAQPFGAFACAFLGVEDKQLQLMHNLSGACNYIIERGYHERKGLSWPEITL